MAAASIQITASDHASAALDKLNKKIAAFSAPVQKARASMAKFGEVSGLKGVAKGFGDIAATAADAFQKIGQIVTPLGAITGAASVAGMYRLVSSWSQWGSQLGFAAQNMALTASQLGNLQGAARLAGASASALTSGMQTLAQTMTDAVGGRNTEAVRMFNTLGISFRDATGHARNAAAVFPELADKVKALKDPLLQARVITTLMGGAAADLLPLARQGAAGIRELQAESAKYNPITQQSIDAANQFRIAQTRLQLSTEGLGNSISTRLSPVISPLMDQFSNWLVTSPAVKHGTDYLGQSVKQFGDYLKGVDWDRVEKGMERWGDRIKYVVALLGGPGAVIRDLFILMVGGFALKVLAPWARLGLTIGGATLKLGAYLLKMREVSAAEAEAAAIPAWQKKGVFPGGIKSAAAEATGAAATVATVAKAEGAAAEVAKVSRLGKLAQFAKFGLLGELSTAFDGVNLLATGHSDLASVMSWALGQGWNDENATFKGPMPNSRGGASGRANEGRGQSGPMRLNQSRPSSAEQAKLAQQAVSYFVTKGWTPAQAAGIAANLQQESGFNAGAVGDSGRAQGLAQWHSDRQSAIEKHFGKSLSQMSMQEQFAAVNWELRNGGEQGAGRRLALATDSQSAGAAVSQFYERPGDVQGEMSRRGGMADQIASRFAATVNAQGSTMQAPNTAPTGGNGSGNGSVTVRLEHANAPPTGFGAAIAGTSGSLGGAKVAQANVMGVLP